MSDLFLTNPGTFHKNRKKKPPSLFDYKEAVADCLMELGIPLRTAEVAVIDMKSCVYAGHHDKIDPMTVAVNMETEVRSAYRV